MEGPQPRSAARNDIDTISTQQILSDYLSPSACALSRKARVLNDRPLPHSGKPSSLSPMPQSQVRYPSLPGPGDEPRCPEKRRARWPVALRARRPQNSPHGIGASYQHRSSIGLSGGCPQGLDGRSSGATSGRRQIRHMRRRWPSGLGQGRGCPQGKSRN